MGERYWTVGTAKDYAKLHGISVRTAQKRMAAQPGGYKTGRGWRIPMLSTDYAKATGISTKQARAKGVKASGPTDLSIKAKILPPLTSRRIVPWTQVTPDRMFGLGKLSSAQYQYQGAAIVLFKISGAVDVFYTPIITSPTPLTYGRLDVLIRKAVGILLGPTSPYTILSTAVVRAKSTHPFTR
jgi:hypothetical protein